MSTARDNVIAARDAAVVQLQAMRAAADGTNTNAGEAIRNCADKAIALLRVVDNHVSGGAQDFT